MEQTPADYIVVNHASGSMVSASACEIRIRHFPPLVSDEPPTRGGTDRGPTPLELVLAALCA